MKESMLAEWFRDTGYWCGRAAGKVLLLGTYVFTAAALVLLATCAFVGAHAIANDYWDFSF